MTTRLTRKEQQALTRSTLLRSATKVLADKGLHRASIDDITGDAGFTKGAFYANFKSKEELFLVMLDEHFAERLAAIKRLTSAPGDIPEQAARAGQDFIDTLRGDQEWCRLFLEFTSHATRHEAFRREMAQRNDGLRDEIAAIYAERAAEAGIAPGIPPQVVARMIFAMAHGAAIEQLMDDSTPSDLLGTMLLTFFAGLAAAQPPA